MSIERFLDRTPPAELTLVVANREAPKPLSEMVAALFENQSVDVTERQLPDAERDTVYLLEDDTLRASSPLAELQETILLVNSDLYITGAREPEDVSLPAVIEALEGVRFRLAGYPESDKEKLLLITLSRYIERLALEGTGTLRSSFQRLSRLEDEYGTRSVYRRLASSPTETHVYGVPDSRPDIDDLVVHAGRSDPYRRSWFVVFVPEDPDTRHAALIAYERRPNSWDGVWTFDPQKVTEFADFLRRELS